ncbi:hypothetical protein H5410_037049 [Solanum commersonii]|uniref:Uncharacterized protein n=1 Tax=Solanum commersonii TaxID=4109 RepID=A0A9J5Y613_SOLCO|nr:hypothetical protein H5410_037049 [Solanum commersonii]
MSTHSLGHHSSDLGCATSLSGKSKTHGWFCICNYKPITLNHSHKEEEWRSPTSNLGKMKSFSLQVSHKTLSKLERKYIKTHQKLVQVDSSTRTIRRSTYCSFHRLFDPLPSGLRILEQRAYSVLLMNRQRFLAMLMLQLLHFFQSFCFFLHLSVHASTKTSNT